MRFSALKLSPRKCIFCHVDNVNVCMCHGCRLRAGNTHIYFCVSQNWSPACVSIGLLQRLSLGWFQKTDLYLGWACTNLTERWQALFSQYS